MKMLLYAVLFVSAYFVAAILTSKETLYDCVGKYDKSKNETTELRVKLDEYSPLTLSGSGMLTVENEVFLVKKEGLVNALYKNGEYKGSLNDLLEIFIDFPKDIFQGKCREI